MEKYMEALAKKLFAQRENQAPAKPDYAELIYAIFGKREEQFDAELNDNAELAKAVNKALSTLRDVERYCLEEKYLHGKPTEQLADEFRRNLDMKKFADEIIEDVYCSIKNEFMENIEMIFYGMEDNSFRELEYVEGMHPENLPKNDTYYEPDADRSVVDILRDTLKRFDGMGLCYKNIFENCFIKGQTKEELAEWLQEHMEEYVFDICRGGLRKLRFKGRSRDLEKLLGYEKSSEYGVRYKDKCGKCIYTITHDINKEPAECSKCRTAEVKKWLGSALSELPAKKKQVIRSLYDLEDGHYSQCGHKKTAVKLRLESKERVMKLEKSALTALRRKAARELLAK